MVDFDAASARFAKEQASRRKQTVAKKEQDAKELARTRRLQAKWEADAAERRAAAAAQQAVEDALRERDLERNHGVSFARRLRPYVSRAAEAKGIVRRADKVCLPRDAQNELDAQSASAHGQLFFSLALMDGSRTTHASILDFSAADGAVGAPPELLHCLGVDAAALEGGSPPPEIAVRYARLKKGTYARLQPVRAGFGEAAGDVKATLEAQLQLRTTLSEGDEVRVADGAGGEWWLRVLELRPEPAVSLIDTDLEVDVAPSAEFEAAEAAAAAERARAEAAAAAAVAARQRADEEAAAAAAAEAAAAAAAAAVAREQREARRAAAEARLAAAEAAEGGLDVAVRCPDGARLRARLAAGAPLAALFDLVEARWAEAEGGPLLPDAFRLASAFPRRVFERPADGGGALHEAMEAAGLGGGQVALSLEA